MKRIARPFTVVGTLSLVAASALSAQSAAAPQPASQIAEWIDLVHATGATPGMAVAVVHGDSVVLARGIGTADLATRQPVTDSTRFYIASTTKALTALAAVILDGKGSIRLDASLARLLPGVRLHQALSADTITMRDLLAMRSGIGDGPVVLRTAYTGEFTTSELLALLREHPAASGGRAFRYSNIGYNVAGLALERRFAKPWHEVVREAVLEPLGMTATTARLSGVPQFRMAMPHDFLAGELGRIALLKSDRTMHAAGGHVTTAGDIARFLIAQLNEGRVHGRRAVPAAAIAATHRQTVTQDRQFSFVRRTGWGLGWDIATYGEMTLYQRNGGFAGYYSHVSFIPERGVGVAVFANGGLDGAASEAVAQGAYDLLLGRRDLAALGSIRDSLAAQVARTRAASKERTGRATVALPQPPERFFGRFVNPAVGTLTLEGNRNALVMRLGDSWGLAGGVLGADGKPVADAISANVLGGEQRFALRFAANGEQLEELSVRGFAFRRVAGAVKEESSRVDR